jgi:hypothetical protein
MEQLRPKNKLDPPLFLVYFYTTMLVENTPTPRYQPQKSHDQLRARLTPDSPALKRGVLAQEGTIRSALAEYLELLLNTLRGEALLIATLAYGLRIPISQVRHLRLRDVSITERLIFIGHRERPIPRAIMEDLREHLYENVCGRDATIGVTRREDQLFSEGAFEQLEITTLSIQSRLAERLAGLSQRSSFWSTETQLQLLGALHAKRMRRAGRPSLCPLDSIDKGPRIVRRGRAGVIDAYYRWRLGRFVT